VIPVLRTRIPMNCFAKHGPRYVSPIPAPSGRPLTKGAFLQKEFRKPEETTQ